MRSQISEKQSCTCAHGGLEPGLRELRPVLIRILQQGTDADSCFPCTSGGRMRDVLQAELAQVAVLPCHTSRRLHTS